MFDMLKTAPRTALLGGLILLCVGLVYVGDIVQRTRAENDGQIGALLDDTWIHVRFADNLAHGHGLSYNIGEQTTGATSPLWVVILAIPYAILDLSPFRQIEIAIGLSVVGYLLSIWAIAGFGWWVTRQAWVGFGAGLLTALTGRWVWMALSGMEVTTFAFLTILALWSHADEMRNQHPLSWRTGLLCALATLTRPEAYLLTALIGFDAFILQNLRLNYHANNQEKSFVWSAIFRHIRAGWRGGILYLLLAGSYPLYAFIISGHPLPNTFRAKSQLGREWPELPYAFFWAPRDEHGWVVIGLAIIGFVWVMARTQRRTDDALAWGIWAPMMVLAVLFLGSQRFVVNNSRYVAPSIPWHALLAMVGLWVLVWFIQSRLPSLQKLVQPLVWSAIGFLGLIVFARGKDNARNVPLAVQQIYQMHVATAEFVEHNTPPDALIAMNDVGVITHLTGRRVLDLEGLVSPEVITATRDTEDKTCPHDLQLARLMLEQQPALVIVFPWWYPCLTSWENTALLPLTVYSITGPTVIGGGEMVVYSPMWLNWPIQSAIPTEVYRTDTAFEHGITLVGYTAQRTDPTHLEVTLWWQANQDVTEYYHIFVHLIDGEGNILAQDDGPPQEGVLNPQWGFSTSWWKAGDIIPDRHTIGLTDVALLQTEGLRWQIGVYRLADQTRLQRIEPTAEFPDRVIVPLNFNLKGIIG
jgi:hypothetical protein